MTDVRFDCASSQTLTTEAEDAIRSAIGRGECIVFPTDTVYGIGADAFNPSAVQTLLDAKGRGRNMPPPVLIAAPEVMPALVVDLPAAGHTLVSQYWPGPLTIIGQQQASLRVDLGETAGTIAVRVPDDELARQVLRITGPLAVSSANRTGNPAATTCDAAYEQLAERVAVYVDGGATRDQQPSTIVDFTRYNEGEVVRVGALSLDNLRDVVPDIRVAEPDG